MKKMSMKTFINMSIVNYTFYNTRINKEESK